MERALSICLNEKLTTEEKFNNLLDLGLDLEDIFEIAIKASDLEK
jgi:hypothetical protein